MGEKTQFLIRFETLIYLVPFGWLVRKSSLGQLIPLHHQRGLCGLSIQEKAKKSSISEGVKKDSSLFVFGSARDWVGWLGNLLYAN